MTVLSPMCPEAFAAYRDAAVAGYAQDNIDAGRWPAEGAMERSRADFDDSLPQGLSTPANYLFEILDGPGGARVGYLWFAVIVKHGLRSAYVYDLEVHPDQRRQGHAKRAFEALEGRVAALGLNSIGLHVFGHNPGAQSLYRQLGYQVTGINMLKTLGRSDERTPTLATPCAALPPEGARFTLGRPGGETNADAPPAPRCWGAAPPAASG